MQPVTRASEFQYYTSVCAEMRDALDRLDLRTASLAAEELKSIQQHSDWPALRMRCEATLTAIAEFPIN
jgi:hypothetical protein